MLLVRSTLRVSNSTDVPFLLTLVMGSTVLWEREVSPESDLAIPAQFCHKAHTRMFYQPLVSQDASNDRNMVVIPRVELPMPEIPGIHKSEKKVPLFV